MRRDFTAALGTATSTRLAHWMVGGKVSFAEVILAFVEERKPDFIAVFPRYWPIADTRPEQFPPLLRLSIRDNIALAGDELVLYSTPWTRYPLREEAPNPGGSRP